MAARKKSRKKSPSGKSGPVRDVIKISPHRVTGGGSIEDITLNGDAKHESPHEKKAIQLFPLCHDVIDFKSQDSREPYLVDGKVHEHIPDFTVNTTFASNLRLEVKALASLVKDANLEKAAHIGRGYRERDEPFSYLVDAQIEQEPMFSNVHLLGRYVTSKPREGAAERATALLANGELPISSVMQQTNLELVDMYTLIARRHLCIDMSQPLDAESLVSLPSQPFKGLSLENILRSTRFGHFLERLALGHRPTDQQLLASAPDWRQRYRPSGIFNFVGGF